jgi:LytS/YehU family sensor histidine kinase
VLRTAIEEQRDLVSVAEEWAFVERYLAIERIRFGDRLTANVEIEELAREAMLPSFSLQTLVENAVRHGAAPRIEATHLHVSATLVDRALSIRVADNGVGGDIAQVERSTGTGLRRLRERMRWLYGDRARLDLSSARTGGFIATLVVPQAATNDVGAVAHDGSNGDE